MVAALARVRFRDLGRFDLDGPRQMILPPAFTKSVRPQPNAYTCGAAALRHAIAWHAIAYRGKIFSLASIAKAARVSKTHGADEHKLARAAERFGYRLGHRQWTDATPIVRSFLRGCSFRRTPVLVPVDRNSDGPWQHWITVVHTTARVVTLCDSERPGPVIRTVTWREFLGRACTWYPGGARFDLYPVVRA